MDAKEIRELIELISASTVSKFEMERDGLKLKVVKAAPPAAVPVASITPVVSPPSAAAPPPVIVAAEAVTAAADGPAAAGTVEVTAPIVGTFYRSPGPDASPFVEIGSKVTKGQVICIIEAMKVMNEIEAEFDAEVVEILVADGQPVEYGETIFRLRAP